MLLRFEWLWKLTLLPQWVTLVDSFFQTSLWAYWHCEPHQQCSCLEALPETVEYYMLFLPWDLQGNSRLSFSWNFQLVVQSLSRVWLYVTPLTAAHQVPLSFTMSQSLLKAMSIESMMLSNYLVFCCPLLLLPSIFSSIRVFSNESSLHIGWPMYWSFSISPSNEHSGLISFRIDSFDLLAVPDVSIVFSGSTTRKHQFFGTQPSLWSNPHIHTWLLEKP